MVRGSLIVPSDLLPYYPPVRLSQFVYLWISLIFIGILFLGWFFVSELAAQKNRGKTRQLIKEITLATVASVSLGFGVLFLMLWSGVWV